MGRELRTGKLLAAYADNVIFEITVIFLRDTRYLHVIFAVSSRYLHVACYLRVIFVLSSCYLGDIVILECRKQLGIRMPHARLAPPSPNLPLAGAGQVPHMLWMCALFSQTFDDHALASDNRQRVGVFP